MNIKIPMRSVLRIFRELPYQFCLESREELLGYQLSLTWRGGGGGGGVSFYTGIIKAFYLVSYANLELKVLVCLFEGQMPHPLFGHTLMPVSALNTVS